MEGRRGGVSDGGGERRDVFFFTQLYLSGRSSSETENSRTFGLRTARVRADATRDAARARAYRVPDVRHDSNPRGTRVDAVNRGTDTSRSRGGSFVTRCARGRSATESHRTVRGTGVGTAGATHLGPVTLILGREGELILPVALLLLLRGRLHHPEERKGAGGQREVRADATTTRGEKGAERFLPIGERTVAGDSPAGGIPAVASADSPGVASAGSPGAGSPAGGSPGGASRIPGAACYTPSFLISVLRTLRLSSLNFGSRCGPPNKGSVRGSLCTVCVCVRCVSGCIGVGVRETKRRSLITGVAGQRLRSSGCAHRPGRSSGFGVHSGFQSRYFTFADYFTQWVLQLGKYEPIAINHLYRCAVT